MNNTEEALPKNWKIKYCCKTGRYYLKWIIRKAVTWKPLSIFFPIIVTGYFSALDVWGEKWGFFSENLEVHFIVFWILLGILMVFMVLKTIVEEQPLAQAGYAREILEDFGTLLGKIVQIKIRRFREACSKLESGKDKFTSITKPYDQIVVISDSLVGFICRVYGLKKDEIDVTIIRKKPKKKWFFRYQYHEEWNHLNPDYLMKRQSAAKSCIESGEPEFYPDKMRAANQNKYLLSKRDKRSKRGSVYVYPVTIKTPKADLQSVITIITYGKELCHDHDVASIELTKVLLSQICSRFELEICLDVIKSEC